MLITNKQLEEIQHALDENEIHQLIRKIELTFPDMAGKMSGEEKEKMVLTCSETASQLNIEGEENILRLLKINFLPPQITGSKYFQKVLYLILNNKNACGSARLDFIEGQLIKRFLKLSSNS